MGKRTKLGLKSDKNFKAIGVGERTSKKVATIGKTGGGSFKRKNANQYYNDVDGIKGDRSLIGKRDYTETRPNRTDKYETGGDIDANDTDFFKKGALVKGKKKKTKKVVEPKMVRSHFEEETFEYKKGGNAGTSCCYTIGGL